MSYQLDAADEFNKYSEEVNDMEFSVDENGEPMLDAEDTALSEDDDQELDVSILEGQNLAETFLTDDQIEELQELVEEGLKDDLESMSEHFDTLKRGTSLLGIKLEDSGSLGPWSCGANHPLIAEAGVKFQAMVINELDPPDNLVKTKIIGTNEELEKSAMRKQDYMNYYLTQVIDDEFYPESARCALNTAYFGTGYKFNYWDDVQKELCSEFRRVDQVIVNFQTKALRKATRYTLLKESSDIDIVGKMNSGLYRQISLDDSDDGDDSTIAAKGLENSVITKELSEVVGVEYSCERLLAYTYILLDAKEMIEHGGEDDEVEDILGLNEEDDNEDEDEEYYDKKYLPFLVVSELYSNKILGVYANWYDNGIGNPYAVKEYITDYHFIPGFGFQSLGYIHVLGNFAKMLTAIMRSLVDAGTFANMPAGFKLKGTKLSGTKDITPGQFIDLETTAQDITKAIMALPFKEPSGVLNAMYTQLEARGQGFANATEGVVAGATNYGPVGTTMALLEASSKMTTAIIRGFHRSRRRELNIIARLLQEHKTEYPYNIDGVGKEAFAQDFDPKIPIFPVSDPNVPSQAQRMALANQKVQIAQQFPQVHNLREALKDVYRSMGEQNTDRLLPAPPEAKPLAPMEETIAASQGMPIKAFPGQAHDAYIAFHTAFIQNPQMAQNPMMQPTLQALTANIRERTIMIVQEQVGAATTGAATDPASQAKQQAMVMQKLTQMAQQAAQAQQNAMDPAMMIAQAQLEKNQIDKARQQSQEVREYSKIAMDAQKLELEKTKLQLQAQKDSATLDIQKETSDNKLKLELLRTAKEGKRQREDRQQKHLEKSMDLLGAAALQDTKLSADLQKEAIKATATKAKAAAKPKKPKPTKE